MTARKRVSGGSRFIGSVDPPSVAETDHEIVDIVKLAYAANLASIPGAGDNPRYRLVGQRTHRGPEQERKIPML
jgi:dTDP-D-glucose 4,6-dehydratase